MKKQKLLAALALTLALCLLPATALANTYTLEDDQIVTVEVKDGVQTVKDNLGTGVVDPNPVFTTNGAWTKNTVIQLVCVDGSGTINVTLQDAKITVKNGNDQSILDVVGSTTANVVLAGNTYLGDEFNFSFYDSALIHVSEGTLNLSGGGEDDHLVLFGDRNGALIGSDEGEDFTGSINLSNIVVYMEDWGDSAVLGSGRQGAFNGSVVLGDGTEIEFCNYTTVPNTLAGQGKGATGSTGTVTVEDGVVIKGDNGAHHTRVNHTLILGGEAGVQIKLGDSALLNANTGAEVKAGLGNEDVVINGTLVEEPEEPAAPEAQPAVVYYAQGEAFRVVDEGGSDVPYEKALEDGVLTITAPEGASLIGALEDLQRLYNEGAVELHFGASILPIAELSHGVGMHRDAVVLTKVGVQRSAGFLRSRPGAQLLEGGKEVVQVAVVVGALGEAVRAGALAHIRGGGGCGGGGLDGGAVAGEPVAQLGGGVTGRAARLPHPREQVDALGVHRGLAELRAQRLVFGGRDLRRGERGRRRRVGRVFPGRPALLFFGLLFFPLVFFVGFSSDERGFFRGKTGVIPGGIRRMGELNQALRGLKFIDQPVPCVNGDLSPCGVGFPGALPDRGQVSPLDAP